MGGYGEPICVLVAVEYAANSTLHNPNTYGVSTLSGNHPILFGSAAALEAQKCNLLYAIVHMTKVHTYSNIINNLL